MELPREIAEGMCHRCNSGGYTLLRYKRKCFKGVRPVDGFVMSNPPCGKMPNWGMSNQIIIEVRKMSNSLD